MNGWIENHEKMLEILTDISFVNKSSEIILRALQKLLDTTEKLVKLWKYCAKF